MKTNIILAACFILIVTFVINFLNTDYQATLTSTPNTQTPQSISPSINNTNTPMVKTDDNKTVIEQPIQAIAQPTFNEFANIDPPALDDRVLFEGLDFTGITQFKIVDQIDENTFLPTQLLPIFRASRELVSIIKIGSADQGDIYYNGDLDKLKSVLNGEFVDPSEYSGLITFSENEITVEVGNSDFNGYPLNIVVDEQILASPGISINQLPSCAEGDSRSIQIINGNIQYAADSCSEGYKKLDEANLIQIKDKTFYNCITGGRDTTVNSSDPRIKEGWVNADDIIEISCQSSQIKSATEIVYFKNLQRLDISLDFPNMELLNNLTNLKYLNITPKRRNLSFKNAATSSISDNKKDVLDATHIRDLENLEFLSTFNIHIISPNYLANFSKLKMLYLLNTDIENYEFAKSLNNIRLFDISNNQLDQFPEIGFSQTIETIRADSNHFTHINGFEYFTNLKSLSLRKNNLLSIDNLDLKNSDYSLIDVFSNPIACDQTTMRKYRFLRVKCL